MQKIALTQKKFALVDDEDFLWLSKKKWYCTKNGYAVREQATGGGRRNRKFLLMHREIMKPENYFQVDHINGNKLDNRRCNLRLCSNAENNWNKPVGSKNTSGYKGVHFFKRTNKWQVQIRVKDKRIHIGYFEKLEDAIRARLKAEAKYHRQFSYQAPSAQ